MATNKRSDEVPTEQPPHDGPLTQLVDEEVRSLPNDPGTGTDEETSGPRGVQKPAVKEYAEGTTEHDDDSES
jgi:hypothetical protein